MAKEAVQIRRAAFAAALRRCYLFSALSTQDLECVASFVVQKRLGKGDCLFREGAPSIGFYVVDQGPISVHRINASGKMQVIHVFRPGESFAEATLVENRGYPADACALEQTSVLLVPKVPFLDLLQKRSPFPIQVSWRSISLVRVSYGLRPQKVTCCNRLLRRIRLFLA